MDPFTQKLLERTQARKEALQQKRLAIANATSPSKPRAPLSEKVVNEAMHVDPNETVELIKSLNVASDFKSKKRHSAEGPENNAKEKKTKVYDLSSSDDDSNDDMAFRRRRPHEPYVVPCTAGRTPKHVDTGVSLKNRLAYLTEDYNAKFESDGVTGGSDSGGSSVEENTPGLMATEVQAIKDNLSSKLYQGSEVPEKKNRWAYLSDDVVARLENDKIEESKPKEQLHRDAMLQKKKYVPAKKWPSAASSEAQFSGVVKAAQAEQRKAQETAPAQRKDVSQPVKLVPDKAGSVGLDDGSVVKPKPRPDLIKTASGSAKQVPSNDLAAGSVVSAPAVLPPSSKETTSAVKAKPRPDLVKADAVSPKDAGRKAVHKGPSAPAQTRAHEVHAAVKSKSKDPKEGNEQRMQSCVRQSPDVCKEAEDEEARCSANVGDKMSIFETKMRLEKEARQKELEAAERLRQKTPRKPPRLDGVESAKANLVEKDLVPARSVVQGLEELNDDDTITTEKVAKQPTPSKRPAHGDTVSEAPSPQKKKTDNVNAQDQEGGSVSVRGLLSGAHVQPVATSMQSPLSNVTVTDVTGDPFDVSSILRAADQEALVQKVTPSKSDRVALRSSTMKDHLKSGEKVAALTQIDITVDTISEDSGDGMSDFARQLRSQKTVLKNREKGKQVVAVDVVSPLVAKSDMPPSYHSFVKAKAEDRVMSPSSRDDITLSPSSSPAKVNRRKMRRSKSFSEGLPKRVLSGYNDKESEKYNVRAANFDLPDVIITKQETIQDLLEEAASQQNIVLQASQALNVALSSVEDKRGSPEVVECERLLLLATEKRTACLDQVQLLKQLPGDDLPEPLPTVKGEVPPCKATITLSEIRLPLDPDFHAALKAGRDLGNFHFVVIISYGCKHVHATKASCTYDQYEGPMLLFDSKIIIKNVSHDFKLSVKVFGLHSKRLADAASKGRRQMVSGQSPGIMKGMFSFTPKRRHGSDQEGDPAAFASPQTVFRTSSFKLVGETMIDLSVARVGKFNLAKLPANCPLDGSILIHLSCQPEFCANVNGFLTILEDVGGYTAWNRRWCALSDHKILYWRYPDDEGVKTPMGSVDLRYAFCKRVEILARDICARPHTFELVLRRPVLKEDQPNLIATIDGKHLILKYWLCADNKDDRINWMGTINRQLSDARAWTAKKSPAGDGVAKPIAV